MRAPPTTSRREGGQDRPPRLLESSSTPGRCPLSSCSPYPFSMADQPPAGGGGMSGRGDTPPVSVPAAPRALRHTLMVCPHPSASRSRVTAVHASSIEVSLAKGFLENPQGLQGAQGPGSAPPHLPSMGIPLAVPDSGSLSANFWAAAAGPLSPGCGDPGRPLTAVRLQCGSQD